MKVFSNTAISLDGRINTREGGFVLLGTARDHARMSRLKAEADAVLVGGATFRNWPHASLPDPADRRADAPPMWNVIVSRSLDLPLSAAYLAEPGIRPLVFTKAAVPAGFGAEVERFEGPASDIPVAWMLDALRRRGIERVLVEAGGDLLFQFLAVDAIDELHVTLCPLVIGGPAPSLADGAGFDRSHLKRLALVAAEVEGDEIFLHYRARR